MKNYISKIKNIVIDKSLSVDATYKHNAGEIVGVEVSVSLIPDKRIFSFSYDNGKVDCEFSFESVDDSDLDRAYKMIETLVKMFTGAVVKNYVDPNSGGNNCVCFVKHKSGKEAWYSFRRGHWVGFIGPEAKVESPYYLNEMDEPNSLSPVSLLNSINKNPPPGWEIRKTEW